MTFTINLDVQFKLTEIDFNNNYLIFANLKIYYQLTRSSKFMKFLKKYYIFQCKIFTLISEYFIHIKIFKKKINVIKIILDLNNRIILYFSISLFQKY